MTREEATAIAPYVLQALAAGVESVAPSPIAALVAKAEPEVERVVEILLGGDPDAIRVQLVSLQKDAIDAAVDKALASTS